MSVSPSSVQRATTPPRSARSSNGLRATCTAAIGASSSASSSWVRVTFASPTRCTVPLQPDARARAPTFAMGSAGRAHGAGTGRSASPSSAARLASQSAAIAFARPSGTQAPLGLVMPPLVTIRALCCPSAARSAPSHQTLVVPEPGSVCRIRASGIEHRYAGAGSSRDRARPPAAHRPAGACSQGRSGAQRRGARTPTPLNRAPEAPVA